MTNFVLHTDNPPELVVRLTHPKIKSHKCLANRPGVAGWRKDGRIVPCTCVMGILRREWFKLFPTKPLKTVKFTAENVIAS